MPKYTVCLQDIITQSKTPLTTDVILTIIGQLLNSLEILHRVGYCHNDIKPTNIMLDSNMDVVLIDLGFSKSFLDSNMKHTKKKTLDDFQGNMLYSSYYQMSFLNTSRRDDLISTCYMLLALFNSNHFPMFDNSWRYIYND